MSKKREVLQIVKARHLIKLYFSSTVISTSFSIIILLKYSKYSQFFVSYTYGFYVFKTSLVKFSDMSSFEELDLEKELRYRIRKKYKLQLVSVALLF